MRGGISVLLPLNKIIEAPGTVSFEETLDLRDMVIGAQQPVTEPVVAAGEVRNVAGFAARRTPPCTACATAARGPSRGSTPSRCRPC